MRYFSYTNLHKEYLATTFSYAKSVLINSPGEYILKNILKNIFFKKSHRKIALQLRNTPAKVVSFKNKLLLL